MTSQEAGNLREELHNLKQEMRSLKRKFGKCWLCGSADNLTKHHLQQNGRRKDGLGVIPLCADCHFGKVEVLRDVLKKVRTEFRKRAEQKKRKVFRLDETLDIITDYRELLNV